MLQDRVQSQGAPGFVERLYARSVRATCEACFPPNEEGAPDWNDTQLESRTLDYVAHLPPPQRLLLKLMFLGVELLAIFLPPGPPFSRRSRGRRTRLLRRWRDSSVLPLRLLGDALKSSLQMVYLAHPDVSRHIGEYKVWSHPDDPLAIETRGSADVGQA